MSQIINADCFEWLAQAESKSIDMVFADLPYGTTRNKWDSVLPLDRLWPELIRVAKPGAAFVFTGQMPFSALLVASNLPMFKHHWIWEKGHATGHLNAKRAPMKAHEDVFVFCSGQPTYNPEKTQGHERKVSTAHHARNSKLSTNYGAYVKATYDSTERYPRTVQKFSSDKQKSKLHPTQKPVALMEYLIKTYSNPGDVVLDPTAGSMTTGIAAVNTGRSYVCIERDEDIFLAGKTRLEEHSYKLD